jgi:NAD(P)H dehydrogenase (quinone)
MLNFYYLIYLFNLLFFISLENIMNNTTILIIGATGNNGVATLNALFENDSLHYTVRAAVRNESKGKQLEQRYPGIETVIIDLDKPETLNGAFESVSKVFIIPGNVENRAEHAKSVIDAAKNSGTVEQVVLYSVVGAEYEAILFAKQFREAEKYLEKSGLGWTHLRTIWFQENFLGWADGIKNGQFYFGVRDGQFAPLNVTDIGHIAANILTTDGHLNTAYNITGPELLGGQQLADVFTEVTGKTVDYVSPPEDATLQSLLDAGWPEWQAKGVLELFEVFASNQAAVVTEDGEKLLGRPLTTFKQFVQLHKPEFV